MGSGLFSTLSDMSWTSGLQDLQWPFSDNADVSEGKTDNVHFLNVYFFLFLTLFICFYFSACVCGRESVCVELCMRKSLCAC